MHDFEITRRDLRIFPVVFLAFWGAVGGVVLWKPGGLIAASVFLSAACLATLLLSKERRAARLSGLLIPLVLGAAGGSVAQGAPAAAVAGAAAGIGLLGAAILALAPGVARSVYVGWMTAAEPLGWAISRLILSIVFFTIVTPVGLVMRLLGYDPMERSLDPAARSYWVPQPRTQDVSRYFKQY